MATARINDINLWYERSHGDGPVLVLTHGFAGPTDGWPPIIDEMRRRFDLVLYDVRAHGRTEVGDPALVTFPQFAADLAALIDHLGLERPHVGGVSMGGMVSAQYACDFPDGMRSLLLCDTTAGNRGGGDAAATAVEEGMIEAFEKNHHIVEKYGLEELTTRENRNTREHDRYAHLQIWTLDEVLDRNTERKTKMMTREGYLAACRAMLTRPDLTSRTPGIGVPTLVSCGEWDTFYPCARRDAGLIPNRRFVTIREAAHSTPDFQPELWVRAVTEFVADVEAGREVGGTRTLEPRTPVT